ncbi:MAG: hypothetical protein JWM20_175 [Patescibacteria group bacterium]|nr:hypothetical protein [Patescibacteria group bacterium]
MLEKAKIFFSDTDHSKEISSGELDEILRILIEIKLLGIQFEVQFSADNSQELIAGWNEVFPKTNPGSRMSSLAYLTGGEEKDILLLLKTLDKDPDLSKRFDDLVQFEASVAPYRINQPKALQSAAEALLLPGRKTDYITAFGPPEKDFIRL